jgi:hypothetical protein
MIDVKDRVPARPNRILITPEDGSPSFFATWERADEPIDTGTAINRILFDSIQEASEWGEAHAELDDIEIVSFQTKTTADWTPITFPKPLTGVPRVFVQPETTSANDNCFCNVRNVTPTGCEVVCSVVGITTTKSGNYLASAALVISNVPKTVNILAVYDGGLGV